MKITIGILIALIIVLGILYMVFTLVTLVTARATYKLQQTIESQEIKIVSLTSEIEEMKRINPWLILLKTKLTKEEKLRFDAMVERIKQLEEA